MPLSIIMEQLEIGSTTTKTRRLEQHDKPTRPKRLEHSPNNSSIYIPL